LEKTFVKLVRKDTPSSLELPLQPPLLTNVLSA
jgi:hypothetical protein